MGELLRKYINNEIEEQSKILELRDNAEFMLDVFRIRKNAIEFDYLSERLKEDDDFIQQIKDILSINRYELLKFKWSLEDYKKGKVERQNQQVCRSIKVGKIPVTFIDHDDKEKNMKVKTVTAKTVSKKETLIEISSQIEVPTKEDKCKLPNCEEVDDKEIENFILLVDQLPISIVERNGLILKYRDASEEAKMIALMMLYDFVNDQGKEESENECADQLMKKIVMN